MNKNGSTDHTSNVENVDNMQQETCNDYALYYIEQQANSSLPTKKPVKLSELINETINQTDAGYSYYVLDKGIFIVVPHEALIAIDEGVSEKELHLHCVSKEDYEIAAAVENEDPNYIGLPDDLMVDPDEMMLGFIETIESDEIYDQLQDAFQKLDSFASVLSILDENDLLKTWFAIRDDHYRKVALQWCEQYQVEYVE